MAANDATASYGADANGLISGYVLGSNNPPQAIGAAEALAWLDAADVTPPPGDQFLWLHFNLAHAATERWLQQNARLSEVFFETLRDGSPSTRVEFVEGALIAVLNDVLFNFSFDPADTATLWLSLTERVVISARRRPLRSIDRLRAAVKSGEIIHSPVELLVHLLRDQGDVLAQIARDATTRVDVIEDTLLAGRADHKRANLGALRRVLVRLQRLLAPEPAALFRLLSRHPQWVREIDVQELRQSTEEFAAVLGDMTALQERIKLIQEEIAAMVAEQNNRSLFVLTIVTVLALPFNIIAGLFGMNVAGIPLAEHRHGFWIVVSIVSIFTTIVGWVAFRNRRD
jgi:zinc transporter